MSSSVPPVEPRATPPHLRLGGRDVGAGQPVLVIAEIGVNHDGSVDRAMELVDVAADCGADAVKLQVFRAANLMHRSGGFAGYQQERCRDADPAAMLRRYELTPVQCLQVVARIRRRGLLPLATPFSLADVEVLRELRLPAVKIASPDLVNRPLLQRAAALGVPILSSTGAASIDEVDMAVGWLRAWGCAFALLHCVSSYPTPAADANLAWVGELARRFAVPVGYSDHSTEVLAGALAVAAGATIAEKHLTYERAADGPDHAASADPAQFAEYVRAIRLAETMRGSGPKRVLEIERDVRTVSRQSLVLARDVSRGRPIGSDDLIVQRPGTGIPAADVDRVIARRPARDLAAGTMLQWEMLDEGA